MHWNVHFRLREAVQVVIGLMGASFVIKSGSGNRRSASDFHASPVRSAHQADTEALASAASRASCVQLDAGSLASQAGAWFRPGWHVQARRVRRDAGSLLRCVAARTFGQSFRSETGSATSAPAIVGACISIPANQGRLAVRQMRRRQAAPVS